MLRVRLRGFEHQITGSRGAPVEEFGRQTERMRRWRENLADGQLPLRRGEVASLVAPVIDHDGNF